MVPTSRDPKLVREPFGKIILRRLATAFCLSAAGDLHARFQEG
jgi:hypothetical protein